MRIKNVELYMERSMTVDVTAIVNLCVNHDSVRLEQTYPIADETQSRRGYTK